MAKDANKKPTELAPATFGWPSLDTVFNNFRKEFEKSLVAFPSMPRASTMSCDVVDDGDRYVIKVEIPGVKKDEIKLNVFENYLEISAKHKEEGEEKKKNYVRKERNEVSYYRTIPLPQKVASDKTQAKLSDGILNVTIQKVVPTSKPKSNTVQVQ